MKCIVLTDSVVFMCQIKNIVNKNIELVFCKTVFEMLNSYNNLNAIVLIHKLNEITAQEIFDNNNKNVFYVKNKCVYDLNENKIFESIQQFFASKMFDKNRTENIEEIVEQKFKKLQIPTNNWQLKFIKRTIIFMKKNNINNVDKKLIEKVLFINELNYKNIYDLIRPTLKKCLVMLNKEQTVNIQTNKVTQIIEHLYNYVFEN